MAQRRMFSRDITSTDAFIDLPKGSQLLYFHLGMNADDDGFISNPKTVMRMLGSSDDELKLLFIKKFLLIFESGVCVVKHWRINNQIRKDRYKETKYLNEKSSLYIRENGSYTFNPVEALPIPKGYFVINEKSEKNDAVANLATNWQPSIGKVRLDKSSKDNKGEFIDYEIPDFIDREVWNEWLTFRKEIKKKMTPATVKKQIKFLKENEKDYKEIIERSIQNGWTGLFPLRKNEQKKVTESKKYAKYDE